MGVVFLRVSHIKTFLHLVLVSALWCYQCVSTQPGCGTPFNWLWHWTKICPEDDDVCVKIIEKKGGITHKIPVRMKTPVFFNFR